MTRIGLVLFATFAVGVSASAQDAPAPIRDNSFLIEEAYNQEPGVIQHILLYGRDRATRDWELGFTQEWPLASQNHQFSYAVPWVSAGGEQGLGDIALNYRYRWLAGERSESVIRVSALLPTGKASRGLGAGGAGAQLNLPVSLALTPTLAAHWNMGGSLTPSARAVDGTRSSVRELFGGASVIWLMHPTLNLLAEAIWSRAESPAIGGTRATETTLTLVPGVRGAINFRSGAQIVPGVGLMLDARDGARVTGLLLYLSFEHAL